MIDWHILTEESSIHELVELSYQVPCLVFKHSSRCSLSSVAKYRLESGWTVMPDEIEAYFLDIIRYREMSDRIADMFQVRHESPQALVIWKGKCIMNESHLGISVQEIRDVVSQKLMERDGIVH